MMLERILLAAALVLLGFALYRALVYFQRRRAASNLTHARANHPMLLIFTSPTCAQCKLQQIPIVEKLMLEWGDRIDALVVDVTEQPQGASQYGVWSLPTTIVVDASQNVIAVNQGVASERKLREQFARAVGILRQLPHETQETPQSKNNPTTINGVTE